MRDSSLNPLQLAQQRQGKAAFPGQRGPGSSGERCVQLTMARELFSITPKSVWPQITTHSHAPAAPSARCCCGVMLGFPSQGVSPSEPCCAGDIHSTQDRALGGSTQLSTWQLKQVETKTEEKCQHNRNTVLFVLIL